jgi:phosphopantothenoylcysteine decarboxylase / phosphopantothenate---cysteine ligase
VVKRVHKGADWIVANDVSGNVMGGDRNQVHLITASAQENWPEMSKLEVARRLVQHITQHFQETSS